MHAHAIPKNNCVFVVFSVCLFFIQLFCFIQIAVFGVIIVLAVLGIKQSRSEAAAAPN